MKNIFVFLTLVSAVIFMSCDTGESIQVQFEEPAQLIVTAKDGTRIFVDIVNPDTIKPEPTSKDILLVTHFHSDHYNKNIIDGFPGEKIIMKTGTLKRENISIVSLPSAHIDTDSINAINASNYIFLIQADGFMIVHTGDYGQTALSAEQKSAMAAGVDLCVMQLENRLSNMDFKNLRAFELIKEMNPGLVIISHFKEPILEYTIKNYQVWSGDEKPIRITENDIPRQTEFILLGKTAPAFSSIYQLKEWHK